MIAEIDISGLANGGGIAIAAYAAIQFGRLVASVVRLGDAARKWFERHEELHESTLRHHRSMAAHVSAEEEHQAQVLRLLVNS